MVKRQKKRQKKQIRECSSAGGVNAAELSGKLGRSKFEDIDLYLLMLPGIILVLVFRFVPLYGLTIAFKNYDMSESIFKSSWVGLKWFRILFESPDFFRIFRNTILINIYDVIFVFGGSIVFAILINEIQSKAYKKVVQTISYLPHFLSWVVVGGMIIQILSPSGAIVKWICSVCGIQPFSIMLNKDAFYGVVTVGEMWKTIGWNTILYLSAISGISPELYEAAKIDGAGRIRQILHITVPGIKFIIVTTLLMRIGTMFSLGFEKIFVLQNDMILETAEVFSTWTYKVGIVKWNMGLSTAVTFFESVCNFILVFAFDKFAKAVGEEGIL